MQCTNQGSGYDREDVQWACTASLPPTLKLGSTDVICEGYSSADDPYVLKGSCGVEYRVVLTDEGERRHPDVRAGDGGTDWSAYLFGVVFFAVAAWIVWSACTADGNGPRPVAPRRRGNGGFWGGGGGGGGWGPGWGGGGGGGGWNDPPPPYSGPKPTGEQGWRPGFWSGLAGGATAGYMAGNRANRPTNNRQGAGWGDNYGDRDYGSGWGGGSFRQGSSSSSSGSNARHESTGFGSTTRR